MDCVMWGRTLLLYISQVVIFLAPDFHVLLAFDKIQGFVTGNVIKCCAH